MTKLFVFLLIGIIEYSGGKPTADRETTTAGIEIPLTGNKTLNGENTGEEKPSEGEKLPADLVVQDILLDPSVILARVTRSAGLSSGSIGANQPLDFRFDQDGIPTFHFARFVRIPRSSPDEENHRLLRRIEGDDHGREISDRFTRSLSDDELRAENMDAAEDGFIIRPLFKYRHEQRKRSSTGRYRNRDSYSYYPRYPVFPGK